MISNRLLQESLEDFKEIVRLPMALYSRAYQSSSISAMRFITEDKNTTSESNLKHSDPIKTRCIWKRSTLW